MPDSLACPHCQSTKLRILDEDEMWCYTCMSTQYRPEVKAESRKLRQPQTGTGSGYHRYSTGTYRY